MHLNFDPVTLLGFSLVLIRATAFVILCPPFNTPAIPTRIKAGFAVALSFVLAHRRRRMPFDQPGMSEPEIDQAFEEATDRSQSESDPSSPASGGSRSRR